MPTNGPGTFETVALELARALQPLAGRLHDPHHAVMLLSELGLRIPESVLSAALTEALDSVHGAAHRLGPVTQELTTAIEGGNTLEIIAKAVPVARDVAALIEAFETIGDEITALGTVPSVTPADLNAFVSALPNRLFETIVVEYFEGYHRIAHGLLEFLGIIEKIRRNTGSSDPGRPEFVEKKLRFDRIGALLQSPDQLLRDLYGWGQPTFDGALLLQRVAGLLRALRVPVTFRQMPGTPPRPAIEVCIFAVSTTEASVTPPGLEATLTATVSDGVSIDLPVAAGWLAHLGAEAALGARVGVRVQPPADVSVIPPSGTVQGRLTAGLARVPEPPDTRITLLGMAGGTGLSAERISLDLVGGFRWESTSGRAVGDFGFEARVQGGRLLLSMEGSDGFIGAILAGLEVDANFTLGLGWTASEGVYFTGSSTLEIQLPVHIALGPVELDALTLSVGIDGNRFPIGLTTNIKAELGPLVAVVEEIGAAVELSFPADGRGDIGPLDIDFKFQPPRGVGLSIDTGIVKGGGYLYIDIERGEYAGALELTFSGFLALKAIGIITTKNPDGSPGFSLLILITAEFASGIQLGFGFALFAVGGLLGLNRTMKLQPLMEGVRSGALNSIMFPQNVVANAPKIISDLRLVFPPQQGLFLIGPMAKLGWGTPPLISVSLGIIIEIPGNIAILGVLKVALPTEKAPVLIIQVNFAGAIEFDKKRLYFFAALFESRVLFITIEGEMGLLVAFGDDANFVVSVGGFHPRFSAPPLPFPSPIRVALNLINESWARVRVEGYFAVTSNSVQFGAAVQVFIGVSAFNVNGHLAFDALFQFSPFYFIISISASFSVKVFGAGLFSVRFSGSLEGPTPWRVAGEGSISILFFDISVDFEVTWGETNKATLPPIEVLPLIRAELNKAENWRALPPAGNNNLLVALRKMPADEAALVLHPVGVLRVSQRAIPFALTLGKVGNQKPSDVNRLTVGVAGGGLAQKAEAFEQFAPAQFQEMSDAEKLSRPAFSKERSGLELSAAGEDLRTGGMTRRVVRYEEIIIDSNFKRFVFRFRLLGALLFNFFLGGAAVARSELSLATKKKYQPFEEKIEVKDATYTVALQLNNQAYSPAAATFTSEASAQEFLRGEVAKDGNLAETLHVIPSWERAA